MESAFLILTSYGEPGEKSVSWILNCYGEPGEKSASLILTCCTVEKAKQFSEYGWKWHATNCSFGGCSVIFPYIHEINTKWCVFFHGFFITEYGGPVRSVRP